MREHRARSAIVRRLALGAIVVVTLASAAPADAAFPGPMGRIAFHSNRDGDFEIYTADPDGTDILQLTANSGYDTDPAWSPDGTKIAYSSSEDIWVMNADGTSKTALTTGGICVCRPAWSPDGTKIAFSDDYDIFVMNATPGATVTNITNSPSLGTGNPSWSPDGTTIIFQRSDGDWEIYSVSAAGGTLANLTDNNTNDYTPDWSPDGTQIAYVGYGDTGYGVVVASADLSTRTWIAGSEPGFPRWSPDGTRIAYVDAGLTGGEDFDIFTVDAGGGTPSNITADSTARDSEPSWGSAPPLSIYQPDGTIRLGSGTALGDDVYNGTGTGQTVSTKARLGSSKVFTVTVGNDGTVIDSIAVGGPKGSDGIKVAYLEGTTGTVDITAAVVAGTYTLVDLAPGAVATIRMAITVTPKADVGDRKTFKITASSLGQAPILDAVRAKVKIV